MQQEEVVRSVGVDSSLANNFRYPRHCSLSLTEQMMLIIYFHLLMLLISL